MRLARMGTRWAGDLVLNAETRHPFAVIGDERRARATAGIGVEPKRSSIFLRREDVGPKVDAFIREARALGLGVECDRTIAHHHVRGAS